jgi:4-deoxy-L-threo-5-hexosulose-uronate ketol-isomerase
VIKTLNTPRASELEAMSGLELQRQFLLDGLFQPGAMRLVYTDLDRLIVGGIMPRADEAIELPAYPELAATYFTERREVGVINIGAAGSIEAGGRTYEMKPLDCLYVRMGEPRVTFRSGPGGEAAFYFLSAPAHRSLATCHATAAAAQAQEIGSADSASRRRIVRYIHEGGIPSCQLVMGFTELADGSVWNTLPPHTHQRRSEVYLYFDLGDNILMHFLGTPGATRHVVVRDRQAVLSPPWSIHMGVGTSRYRFIWGMAGENRAFNDMDPVDLRDLA